MKTKEKVLILLQQNIGRYMSGQEIADKLYMTRASVWKAVKSLKGEGCEIDAVTNKGYRLKEGSAPLNADKLRKYLEEYYAKCTNENTESYNIAEDSYEIAVYDRVTSTNDAAVELLKRSVTPCIVIADEQTEGRGRRGRSFYSPKGTGLYLSFAFSTEKSIDELTVITAIAAAAAARAIDMVIYEGRDVSRIKWVNDIYIGDGKAAGILAEGLTSFDGSSMVVVGFGVNVFTPAGDFPKEIRDAAGTATGKIDDMNSLKNTQFLREKLAAGIINEFIGYLKMEGLIPTSYVQGEESEDEADRVKAVFLGGNFIDTYRAKSFIVGTYVKICSYHSEKANRKYAYVLGITDDCHLKVRYDDGCEAELSTGEVSVVRY